MIIRLMAIAFGELQDPDPVFGFVGIDQMWILPKYPDPKPCLKHIQNYLYTNIRYKSGTKANLDDLITRGLMSLRI